MSVTDRLTDLQNSFSAIDKRLRALERSLDQLERAQLLHLRQESVFARLAKLEASRTEAPVSNTETRLGHELKHRGITSYRFQKVPNTYYTEQLEWRRNCLQAPSVRHLCKSLVFENPKLPDNGDSQSFRHYLVIVQYAAKLHGEKVKRFLHKQNGKLGIQYFRPRQAPPETSEQLTGYASGSVTPVGLQNKLPILMSDAIAHLQPAFFWMGGGEEFLKLGLNIHDFITAYKPFIVDCTY